MLFKFRARVRVKAHVSKLLKPDGSASQTEFFQGTTGAVIRHDDAKGGYLVVLDCPEIKAAMGETITAYFAERELEALEAVQVNSIGTGPGVVFSVPDLAKPGPFEFPPDTTGAPYLPNQIQFNKTSSPMIKL